MKEREFLTFREEFDNLTQLNGLIRAQQWANGKDENG